MKNLAWVYFNRIKTYLFIPLLILLFEGLSAQEFAPIGAEWHYTEGFFMSGDKNFLHISSVKDTLFHGKTCRKLIKDRDIWCNMRPSTEFVYQEDSIVYFWQSDLTGFQPLIDYKANTGDSWIIAMNDMEFPADIDSVQIRVDSTSFITINNTQLKVQWVTYTCLFDEPFGGMSYTSKIIEKIGDTYFLFNIFPELSFVCDGNYSEGLRCYRDQELGLYDTGIADSCDYVFHWTGFEQIETPVSFSFFPNPAKEKVNITTDNDYVSIITMSNIYGQHLLKKEFISKTRLNISGLPQGIYLISVKQNNRLTAVKKLFISQF